MAHTTDSFRIELDLAETERTEARDTANKLGCSLISWIPAVDTENGVSVARFRCGTKEKAEKLVKSFYRDSAEDVEVYAVKDQRIGTFKRQRVAN